MRNESWLEPWASIEQLRAEAPRYFEQLCYHEAGHAVAAWAWQFDIRYVTLDDGGLAHRPICSATLRLRCSLCVLAFTFAALEAERKLCLLRGWPFDARGPNWFANDREDLKEIGQPHRHGAAVLRARRLLALPDAWAAVEAIADALVQAPGYRLSGAEVARICRHGAASCAVIA